jgi:hypothetical protein
MHNAFAALLTQNIMQQLNSYHISACKPVHYESTVLRLHYYYTATKAVAAAAWT